MLWKNSPFFLSRCSDLSSMAKRSLYAGVAEAFMPKSAIASFKYSVIKSVTVPLPLNVMSIPKNT